MRTRALFVAFASLVACLVGAPAASAVVVDIVAARDATLYQDPEGLLASGAGPRFFVGRTDQSDGYLRRGLVYFDVASVIPPGSTINSVTLTLYMSRTQAGATPITMHRTLADWGEGASVADGQGGVGATSLANDATWIHTFYPSSLWSTPGGDFSSLPSATQSVAGTGFYSWSGAGLVADVQAWIDAVAPNHGWLLRGDESVTKTAKRFESRESTNSARRPTLTIDYTPGAATGACCLPSGECVTTTSGQCATLGGVYQGDGAPCDPNPCPQPTGACCLPEALCLVLSQAECEALMGVWHGAGTDCTGNPCGLVPFVDPLPVPGVMQPVTGSPGGAAHYEIAATEFVHQFHRDLGPAVVWGYDGTFPAKSIEARTGHPVTVTWSNDLRDENGVLRIAHYLDVDTCLHGPDMTGETPVIVTHLHGGKVPSDSDGHPDLAFPPGQSAPLYTYPNDQQAAPLWFHDHALGITRLNVYMGLAGFYLLRDDVEDALGLPAGEYELPLAIQDRTFNPDGTLFYPALWQDHFHGEYIIVNGKVAPYHNVKRGKYRLRMVNGCGSRTLTLSLSNGASFIVIGTDGGLLPAPLSMSSVTISPGERIDVVVDFGSFAAAAEVIMSNSAPSHFPGEPGMGVVPNVMKFIVGEEIGHTDPIPPALRPVEPIPMHEVVQTRDFELRFHPVDHCGTGVWLINGLHWNDITEQPVLGTAEVWRFINRSAVTHPMHMHLVMFQAIDRQPFSVIDGEIVPTGPAVPMPPEQAGWKDTVQVHPNEIVRVVARFQDFPGLFAYHCHILEHEDHEMMRQFRALPACPGDLNYDRVVNGTDLGLLLGAWGTTNFYADINASGSVDGTDLGLLLGGWGACPAPPPDLGGEHGGHE